jgi:hypothetical protein
MTAMKVLRPFPYSVDGIRSEQLEPGMVRDIEQRFADGLIAEGFAALASAEEAKALGAAPENAALGSAPSNAGNRRRGRTAPEQA